MSIPSRFPEVAPLPPYATAIANLERQYNETYPGARDKLQLVEGLILEWKDRHEKVENNALDPMPEMGALSTECQKKADLYIDLHDALIGPKADGTGIYRQIHTIIEAYQHFREEHSFIENMMPSPDLTTLIVLQRLGLIDLANAKTAHDKVFTTDANRLSDQQKTMQAVFDRIRPALVELKQALEPLAEKVSQKGWALPRVFNTALGRAAYVKTMVEQRRLERVAEVAPAPAAAASAPAAASPKTYASVVAGASQTSSRSDSSRSDSVVVL